MLHRVMSCQDISVQVKSESGQVISGQVRLGDDKFKSGQIRSEHSRTDQMKSG